MKIMTDRRILVRLTNIPFSAAVFDMLVKLSLVAPNLRLEAVEFHTSKPLLVRLCSLDFDWRMVNSINANAA